MKGYFRLKRERREFHTRLLDGYNDLRVLLSYGIAVGLVFSLVTIGAGLVIPVFALTLIGALSVLFALTRNFHLVSAAITTGFSYFLLVTVHYFDLEIPYVHTYLEDLNLGLLSSVMVLAGVLTLIEGILIKLNGWKHTSPRLIKSERFF